MNQSMYANIPLKEDADKLWEKKAYKDAADKYLEAAKYAQNELKDIPLQHTFMVDYYLSLCLFPTDLDETAKIKKLLNEIDTAIKINEDDRNYLFVAYKFFYTSYLLFYSGSLEELQEHRTHLEGEANGLFPLLNTVSLCITNLGILRAKLKDKNFDTRKSHEIIENISKTLEKEIDESNLQHGIKDQLLKIIISLKEKKKIILS